MKARLAAATGPLADALAPVLGHRVGGPLAKTVAAVVATYLMATVGFGVGFATIVQGVSVGTLYGLMGVGIVLIYRTNRIINFAAAGLGAVPGVFAALLLVVELRDTAWWFLCFPMAVVGGGLIGGVVDIAIVRRFSHSPRLILTVATIGITQILAFLALLIPIAMGSEGKPVSFVPTPFKDFGSFNIGNQPFTGDYTFTFAIAVIAVTALTFFLRFTRMGIALRASAENADRASLLGIPVKRVETVAWIIAGALGGLTIFQRAAVIGVPTDGSLGLGVLLFALTAAVVARMESIPVCLGAGMVIGVVASSSVAKTGAESLGTAIMLIFILGVLLVQRGRFSRAYDTGTSSWQAVREFRPIPAELRRVPEVFWVRIALFGAVLLAAVLAAGVPPLFGGLFPLSRIGNLQVILITAIIAVSLVILTGWAGQISLGQFAFVGVGAAVAGKLAAEAGWDFFIVVVLATLAGAAASILVGLPALRIQGLYLAVTTLAFAAAMEGYLLNRAYSVGQLFAPDTDVRIEAPILWERVALTNDIGIRTHGYYYLCLAFLLLVMAGARAYRRNRAGRVLIGVRENIRAAGSYAINPARTKLAAFAVSGAIAALGGVLLAYQLGSVDRATYGMQSSVTVFLIAVIGGLTSIMGAVTGAVIIQGLSLFGNDLVDNLDLLVTGPGLLLVLLFIPGGFAEVIYRVRDKYLRWVANRRGLLVPSLVADRRAETEAQEAVVSRAEQRAEEAERAAPVGSGGGA